MEPFISFEKCIGIVLVSVALPGSIGNLLTIFNHPINVSRARNFIFSLAIFDLVFLVCATLLFGLPLISVAYKEHTLMKILPFL